MLATLVSASIAVGLFGAAATAEKAEVHPAPAPHAAFDKLKALLGDWQAPMPEGKTATVSYRLASNGTVIVETMNGGTKDEMISVYHRDKDGLQMTHFCSMGNQPRLRAAKWDGDKLAFRFVDVTNADAKKGGFIDGLTIVMKDADHVDAIWTSKDPAGKTQPWAFNLTRVKASGM